MLLMVEGGNRGGICQAVFKYYQAFRYYYKKYMSNYDKRKMISYLMYLDASNLYGWAMSQKLPADGFKWIKDLFQFNERFIKNYGENSNKAYFLEVNVECPKNLFDLHKDLPFLPKRKTIEKVKKYMIKDDDKRPLPIGKNKKVPGLFKDELGRKIMKEFCTLRAKTYAYLMDDDSEKKKAKGTKKCVLKRRLMFENYKVCLFNDKIILKSQQRLKSDYNKVYTEEVNKIGLSSDVDKRLQSFDTITTYPHGTNAFKVCESEMLMAKKYKDLVVNDKNCAKDTNEIFKVSVTKCILNRSIKFRKRNTKIPCLIIQMILKKQTGFLKQLLHVYSE